MNRPTFVWNKLFAVLLSVHSVKTPSYQGLKFLSDLLLLKETAILSDSDPDMGTSHDDSPTNAVACPGESHVRYVTKMAKFRKNDSINYNTWVSK